jgi:flagellar assembly protein FliH
MTSSTDTSAARPAGGANLYTFKEFERSTVLDVNPADVLTAARADAERIRSEARHAGEAEGYKAGIAQALADATPLADALRAAADGVEASLSERIETLTRQATELAVEIAEQILSATVEARPELVLEVARGALRRLSDRSRATIKVNPEDLALMTQHTALLQSQLGGIEQLEIQAERRIARGGAVVSTAAGEIDCSFEAQLRSVREIISAELAAADHKEPDAAADGGESSGEPTGGEGSSGPRGSAGGEPAAGESDEQ